MKAQLCKSSYEKILAFDGTQALELTHQAKPDLVLLDIRMPGLDGHEVCKRIEGDTQLKHIPVIYITANPELVNSEMMKSTQADDFILKPYEPSELLEKISRFLGA